MSINNASLISVYAFNVPARLFVLRAGNIAEAQDEVVVRATCQRHGGHLVSAEELRRAVAECSFTTCVRGWLTDSRTGTVECDGGNTHGLKTVSVTVENISAPITLLDIFCVNDRDKPCGGLPTFLYATLQSVGGLEVGNELLYQCHSGHSLPDGHSTFSLLYNVCGKWHGQVPPCLRENRVLHDNYKHLSLEDGHLALEDLKLLEEEVKEDLGFNEQGSLDQKGEDRSLIGRIAEEDEMEHLFGKGPQVLSMSTESSRSWFSSQLIHRTESNQQESGGVDTRGDNNRSVKTSGSDAESTKANNSTENFTIITLMQHKENPIRGFMATDGTWKIGYPGHQDNEERGKAGDSTNDDLEEQSQESNIEDALTQTFSDAIFMDPMQVMEWNGKADEDEVDTTEEAVLEV